MWRDLNFLFGTGWERKSLPRRLERQEKTCLITNQVPWSRAALTPRNQERTKVLLVMLRQLRREMQKAFIEELTRINFERETAKKSAVAQPIRGFFDTEISA